MAQLKGPLGWLVAALVICCAVSLAYLPPRGTSRESRASLSGLVTGPPTAERLRANELAKEWRRAALDVQLHEWRGRLGPELERRRTGNQPTLVITIDSSWSPVVRARAQREIEKVWQALELGTTKIGIAVVIESEHVAASAPAGNSYAHLLPDSLERHTCVVWTAPRPTMGASFERSDARAAGWHAQWARSLLGPCAFYARFGRPSAQVERWLAHRQHRFAQIPAWDSTWTALLRAARSEPGPELTPRIRAALLARTWRTYPALSLGCMSGRATACREAIVGVPPSYGTAQRLVTRERDFEAFLPASTVMLSDMVREFGHARFARFWVSDLAPDSAFHLAMDTTLGDWVWSRMRLSGATLTAGPTPGLGVSAFGLGVAAFCIGLAIVGARRRQVG